MHIDLRSHRLLSVVIVVIVVFFFLFITWQTTLQSHTDSLCDLHFDDCKLVTGSRDKTVKGTVVPPPGVVLFAHAADHHHLLLLLLLLRNSVGLLVAPSNAASSRAHTRISSFNNSILLLAC
jgi:CDP-diacylglycerol pyrophosphatase